MSTQPFTFADLLWGETVVRRLHEVEGTEDLADEAKYGSDEQKLAARAELEFLKSLLPSGKGGYANLSTKRGYNG